MRERVKPSVDSTEEGRRELARKRVASDATAARARYELCGIYEGAARRLGLDRRTVKARVDPALLDRNRSRPASR